MNPQTPTHWLPGLIVLAVGFIAAALFLLTQRRKGGPTPEPARDGALEDLERRYQSLIEQLKELAADKHTLAPEHYEAERTRLEQEAVAALRARDEHQKKQGARAPEPRTAPASRGFLSPQLKGALWGGGIVLFFGVLGYTLVSEQRARGEDDTATGRVPPGMGANAQQQQQPQEDEELRQAWERLKENPSDLDTAALLSHELIRRQMYEDAERVTQRGLSVDPFNVELRVHQGVLRAVRGDEQGAEQELLTLVDTYPDAQESLLFLGALAMKQGNRAKALEYFERFAVEVPANLQPPPLLAAIQQLRGELHK